jgi:polyhydroxyalkanoate synthesis regulator phasin
MFTTPFERIKALVNSIQKLEDKLMNTGHLPMSEQKKIHEEIRKFKEEMDKLERRTRT